MEDQEDAGKEVLERNKEQEEKKCIKEEIKRRVLRNDGWKKGEIKGISGRMIRK